MSFQILERADIAAINFPINYDKKKTFRDSSGYLQNTN